MCTNNDVFEEMVLQDFGFLTDALRNSSGEEEKHIYPTLALFYLLVRLSDENLNDTQRLTILRVWSKQFDTICNEVMSIVESKDI